MGWLSHRAHIHLFRVSGETTSAQDWAVLRTLRNDDRVEAAQFNHTVQNRETLPNDPQIGQQWHHVENGDHDIDSDLEDVILANPENAANYWRVKEALAIISFLDSK